MDKWDYGLSVHVYKQCGSPCFAWQRQFVILRPSTSKIVKCTYQRPEFVLGNFISQQNSVKTIKSNTNIYNGKQITNDCVALSYQHLLIRTIQNFLYSAALINKCGHFIAITEYEVHPDSYEIQLCSPVSEP